MRKTSSRRGFTLPEVLVTVTIVAVLAAVMVPAVINQVAKGDTPAVSQDIGGLRTAVTTFAADTRHFPKLLSDLGGSSITSTALDIQGNAYGSDAVAGYKGPYASIVSGHIGPTSEIYANTMVSVGRAICMQDSVLASVSQISASQVARIKTAVDQNNPAIGGSSGVSSAGSVTYQLQNNTGVVTVVPGTVRVCLTSF